VGGKEYMKLIRILARLGKYQDAMGYLEEMGQVSC
jgi:pentatricopeptide repeat protein